MCYALTTCSLQMSKTRYNPCNAPPKPQILLWIIHQRLRMST